MQSVPIPLVSSLINIHSSNNSNSNTLTPRNTHNSTKIPLIKSSYNEAPIVSTELECFISKPSTSSMSIDKTMIDSIHINEVDIDNIDLSSNDGVEEVDIEDIDDLNALTHNKYKKRRRKRRNPMIKCKHPCHENQPDWLVYIANLDRICSSKIHKLSLGTLDYLFVFGAFVFGSKFMPITILLSIFLVDIPGFIYLLLSCTITVTLTQSGKKLFGRHRPDPNTLGHKLIDFRTRLTNYAFPSGDTAQAAAYSMSLFCLTHNVWLLLLIPNTTWSRVYFGCHWICDCIMGAIVGCIIPMFIYSMIPQESFRNTQQSILNWMH